MSFAKHYFIKIALRVHDLLYPPEQPIVSEQTKRDCATNACYPFHSSPDHISLQDVITANLLAIKGVWPVYDLCTQTTPKDHDTRLIKNRLKGLPSGEEWWDEMETVEDEYEFLLDIYKYKQAAKGNK